MQKVLDNWFNYYVMIIYLFFTAAMVWLIFRRKLNTQCLILPVAILGAVLYHMLFEAKSQYFLPYFILMVPFAVYGFVESISTMKKKLEIFLNKKARQQ